MHFGTLDGTFVTVGTFGTADAFWYTEDRISV